MDGWLMTFAPLAGTPCGSTVGSSRMQRGTSPAAPVEIWVWVFVRNRIIWGGGWGWDSYSAVIGLEAEDNWDTSGAGVAGWFDAELPETGVDVTGVEWCGTGTEGDAEEGNGGGGGEMHC